MIAPAVTPKLLSASDKRFLWHPFTQMRDWCAAGHDPLVLVAGEGAVLEDDQGRRYLDGNSSIWTNIHGHRHPRIDAAIREQLAKVAHVSFLGTTNEPATLLAERLVALFPAGTLTRVFYSDDGSTAVEVALKMSLQFWQLSGRPHRSRFLAFASAYHGDTTGASSLGGVSAFTERFSSIHFPVERIADLEGLAQIDPEPIAAVIIEPVVQGAAGIRIWPDGMLRALRSWCDRHEVLLIFDEVLTGFGRTGRMFACETEGIVPDLICLAKGLTGGYLPLAATLTTERVFSAFLGEYADAKTFFYGHSYCGNPLGCAAALASLTVFEEERTIERLAPKITLLREELAALRRLPWVADIRQAGFIAGIEIRHPDGTPFPWEARTGARVCQAARGHGLLTRPILDTLVLIPPLCTSDAQIKLACQALEHAISEVLRSPVGMPR